MIFFTKQRRVLKDPSDCTEPTQVHCEVRDQWLLMQGTEVQNACAGNEVVRHGQTTHALSRGQRGFRILWTIGRMFVVVRFCENVNQVHVLRGFKSESDEEVPSTTWCIRIFRYNAAQSCIRVRSTYHCATFDGTSFENISSPVILFASFANQVAQKELVSGTTACRQLRHRHVLLEFRLQMTILPRFSDGSNDRIRETCCAHPSCATARHLRRRPTVFLLTFRLVEWSIQHLCT